MRRRNKSKSFQIGEGTVNNLNEEQFLKKGKKFKLAEGLFTALLIMSLIGMGLDTYHWIADFNGDHLKKTIRKSLGDRNKNLEYRTGLRIYDNYVQQLASVYETMEVKSPTECYVITLLQMLEGYSSHDNEFTVNGDNKPYSQKTPGVNVMSGKSNNLSNASFITSVMRAYGYNVYCVPGINQVPGQYSILFQGNEGNAVFTPLDPSTLDPKKDNPFKAYIDGEITFDDLVGIIMGSIEQTVSTDQEKMHDEVASAIAKYAQFLTKFTTFHAEMKSLLDEAFILVIPQGKTKEINQVINLKL